LRCAWCFKASAKVMGFSETSKYFRNFFQKKCIFLYFSCFWGSWEWGVRSVYVCMTRKCHLSSSNSQPFHPLPTSPFQGAETEQPQLHKTIRRGFWRPAYLSVRATRRSG
jgi:hypothetical protein